ncbi:uncharacterized protein LOC110715447 [Chenopodium quinoa]|uniref:uncharacterized protein LOC110715447 n=1 Tax=Chenopodium quinoa TaxID=63459 RepID=UPI000B77C6C2|nr:uncharacterized protein LOC110715447 [Chenopodium quinoa]
MSKWKLFHDGIAAKANLARRGIQLKEVCDHCGVASEDSHHLFSSVFWQRKFSEDGKHSHRCALFIAILWGLWKSRNERCFKNARSTRAQVMELISLAMKDHETFTQQGHLARDVETNSGNDPIFPPGFNYVHLGKETDGFDDFIVEVDGSWDKKTTRASIGWAVKSNSQGHELEEGGKHGAASSVLHCEAWACLEAMKWAHAKGKQGILILSDSTSLLDNLQDNLGRDILITWILK